MGGVGPGANPMFPGLHIPACIFDERERQKTVEGWSPEHDDNHDTGSMLRVARIYWLHAVNPHALPKRRRGGRLLIPTEWPWEPRWWKPKSPRRDLERAGALCLAEAERLRRANPGCSIVEVGNTLRMIVVALQGLPE